jgi:uncharacterized repeat protein (TIGR03803 family)
MQKLSFVNMAISVLALWVACVTAAPAQTFTTLVSFDAFGGQYPGAQPNGFLVQGVNGNLYGTTSYDGPTQSDLYGTIFEITPSGALTTLRPFNFTDGAYPAAGLAQASNGNLYGTAFGGGGSNTVCTDIGADDGCGVLFDITPAGKVATLYKFCSQANCADGANPLAGLIQATNGNFYGTAWNGGGVATAGTIFEITPGGKLTTLYSFCSQTKCADGSFPYAGLVQATDGNFYGTAAEGGLHGDGTVFGISPQGKFKKLYDFCSQPNCADGSVPVAGLVQASNGNFYGTTQAGGVVGCDGGCGTVFQITPAGQLTTLYSFCSQTNCADGQNPYAGLVQGSDGNFYGTTYGGGANGAGTVFQITPTGTLATLHSFESTEGAFPSTALVQATNGIFYGTTFDGGANGDGALFSLSVNLSPFVETIPTVGKVGAKVTILGNDLTGTTGISFNGTAAAFTVDSDTEITAIVPTGATTGTVQAVTPGGTLNSNLAFRVSP